MYRLPRRDGVKKNSSAQRTVCTSARSFPVGRCQNSYLKLVMKLRGAPSLADRAGEQERVRITNLQMQQRPHWVQCCSVKRVWSSVGASLLAMVVNDCAYYWVNAGLLSPSRASSLLQFP